MNSKEMFYKLGFKQIKNDDDGYIKYVRKGDFGEYTSVLFALSEKTIKTFYYYRLGISSVHEITSDELKAIICQAQELGWLR